nr:glycosyl transferase family 90 [Haloferula sp. BvORR071]
MVGVPAPCLPFPCPFALRWPDIGIDSSESLMEELIAAEAPYKDERIFWIGADTHSSRRALRDLGQEHPTIFDVELMEWARDSGNTVRSKTRQVSIPEHRDYKYLIDCQGYGYSGRLKWLLASGRPVFVVDRNEVEHWHDEMKPWVHYIPVEQDLSDLLDNYKRVEESPSLYEEIWQNAREFAASRLRLEEQFQRVAEAVAQLAPPRPGAGVLPKLPKKRAAMVVARYEEDISWIDAVPDFYQVFVVNKGKPLDASIFQRQSPHIVEWPNIGRESDTYLNFMEKRWHQGYEWMVFAQGDPFPHSPAFIQLLDRIDRWADFQPLSCRWFHLPPDTLLEHDKEHWIDGLAIRKELISLHTMNMIRYHDPGSLGIMNGYMTVHGLLPGTNIAAHFFQSIGMADRAREAAFADLGSYSFGAIFAVKSSLIDSLSPEVITNTRRFAQTHPAHGYIIERMWLHLFGEPFIPTKPPQAAAAADLILSERMKLDPVWSSPADIVGDLQSSSHADSFLLFGLGEGSLFDRVKCSRKVSVDPVDTLSSELAASYEGESESLRRKPTYRMSAGDFFAQNDDGFDIIVARHPKDGDELRSILYGGLKALNRGGTLVCGEIRAEKPGLESELTGEAEIDSRWKEWIKFRAAHPELRMFVIDTAGGIGVILRNAPAGPVLPPLPDTELTWANYIRHRKEWLDLLSPLAAKRLYVSILGDAAEQDFQESALPNPDPVEKGRVASLTSGV